MQIIITQIMDQPWESPFENQQAQQWVQNRMIDINPMAYSRVFNHL